MSENNANIDVSPVTALSQEIRNKTYN